MRLLATGYFMSVYFALKLDVLENNAKKVNKKVLVSVLTLYPGL